MKTITLDNVGRAYCHIDFKPHDDTVMRSRRFKIDTGADVSTIPKGYLYHLGYEQEWILANAKPEKDKQTTTATGEVVTNHIIQLPLLNIYGYEAINWPFAILMDDCRDYRPLLGLDLLAGFNFHLDNGNNSFSLARLPVFNPRRSFLPGQEIHSLTHLA
jgi:hypothetical protein